MKNSALYIHIPFCEHKCIYCDFYSIITKGKIELYLNSLLREMSFYSEKLRDTHIFDSIYFGGGTPSLLQTEHIAEIMNKARECFNIAGNAEITLETNPGTVNKEKIAGLRKTGINRISIGIQSFYDEDLRFLTRIHNSKEAREAVNFAVEGGFDNINVDLIFNLPKQTKQKWFYNLIEAAQLPITHISTYSLILEPGTILNKMVIDNKVKIEDPDYDADLYMIAMDYLTSQGFKQYEVSNFALPGYECRHNKAYWQYLDYLGLGPSSHSFINNERWKNINSVALYSNAVNTAGNAKINIERINEEKALNEYVMLTLRSSGIDIIDLVERFGDKWLNKNEKYLELIRKEGYIQFEDNRISLTKKGYAICDEILVNMR
jgi:oxygen-independent coproporphyrinogen-3 oxidase